MILFVDYTRGAWPFKMKRGSSHPHCWVVSVARDLGVRFPKNELVFAGGLPGICQASRSKLLSYGQQDFCVEVQMNKFSGFTLQIKMGNDGCQYVHNVVDILDNIATKIDHDQTEGVIIDLNGNKVGSWEFF